MAKRRKLEAPSAEDLSKIEEEFRRETSPRKGAPIAQVAGEAAGAYEPGNPEERANRARDAEDAQSYREATEKGLITEEIPLDLIDPESMPRDRTVMDKDSLAELEWSIALHGLRLPIEIYKLPEPRYGRIYGVLSGYRRYYVIEGMRKKYPDAPEFKTIKSIVRDPEQLGGAFSAMVEENEIRQDLSHYERGRIAVIAAQEGAFVNTEAAVNQLFGVSSKAKRSKIRSFAMIFEELGDLLAFPEKLTEKQGLRIASALRDGAAQRLREVLESGQGTDSASEWDLIEAVLKEIGPTESDPKRGGRPRVAVPPPGWNDNDTLRTTNGITMRREYQNGDFIIRFKGKQVNSTMIEVAMIELERFLQRDQ